MNKIKHLELRVDNGYTVAKIGADLKNGFNLNNILKMYLECKDYDGEVLYKLADDPESKNVYDAKSMIDTMIVGADLYEGRKVILLVEGTDEKAACLARRLNSAAISSDAYDETSDRLGH